MPNTLLRSLHPPLHTSTHIYTHLSSLCNVQRIFLRRIICPIAPTPLRACAPAVRADLIRWGIAAASKRRASRPVLTARYGAREHWRPSQVTGASQKRPVGSSPCNKIALFVPDLLSHHRGCHCQLPCWCGASGTPMAVAAPRLQRIYYPQVSI
jgi:hypothetical protein